MTHEASRTPAPALTPRLPEGLTCRIIGLGGIGQIVAVHLTRFLCSVPRAATVMLIDGDDFEHGNETRMLVPDYYRNKAESLQAELAGQCASSEVTMVAVPEYVSPDNIDRLVPSGPGEFVLLCVDNHATRNLVGTHACGLDDICVISGGNDGVGRDGSGTMRHGTAGNVQIYIRAAGKEKTPSLMKFHPEIADPSDRLPEDAGCGELLASVPQILFANLCAASCMLSTWWLHACAELDYCELVFDIRRGRMAPLLPLPVEEGGPQRPSPPKRRGSRAQVPQP
jgi:molybdopterin/thiamine biosynthesis adenylyltransferase